jgi:ribosomal 50S subunit-recycling heat shock protein
VFHVSQLKKCEQIPEAQTIVETNAEIELDLSLAEYPMRVLDQKERQTRRQKVKMYKIQWSHHTEEEATWETVHFLNTKYLCFLQIQNRT